MWHSILRTSLVWPKKNSEQAETDISILLRLKKRMQEPGLPVWGRAQNSATCFCIRNVFMWWLYSLQRKYSILSNQIFLCTSQCRFKVTGFCSEMHCFNWRPFFPPYFTRPSVGGVRIEQEDCGLHTGPRGKGVRRGLSWSNFSPIKSVELFPGSDCDKYWAQCCFITFWQNLK